MQCFGKEHLPFWFWLRRNILIINDNDQCWSGLVYANIIKFHLIWSHLICEAMMGSNLTYLWDWCPLSCLDVLFLNRIFFLNKMSFHICSLHVEFSIVEDISSRISKISLQWMCKKDIQRSCWWRSGCHCCTKFHNLDISWIRISDCKCQP